jgi:hypothetical protein
MTKSREPYRVVFFEKLEMLQYSIEELQRLNSQDEINFEEAEYYARTFKSLRPGVALPDALDAVEEAEAAA